VQTELQKCQRAEGVNHYESCKWLADKYITMLKENKVRPKSWQSYSALTYDLVAERLQARRRIIDAGRMLPSGFLGSRSLDFL
jgi:hypothetical protein